MSALSPAFVQPLTPAHLHAAFLAVLPRIRAHARVQFRDVRCPHRRDDAVAESMALAWSWFARLAERGKDPLGFVSALATYAARHVRAGRGLCGQERTQDVLSGLAQRRHRFAVTPLREADTSFGNLFAEALHDNTQTEVPEQVAFRLDFPAWCATRCDRDRRVIDDLMTGERTRDVADRHGLSPGRVSQLRQEFFADWAAFCGAGLP